MLGYLAALAKACFNGNIELFVFFNGALEKARLHEWVKRQGNERQTAQQIVSHVQNKGTPPPKVWFLPPVCMAHCIRLALIRFHIKVRRSPGSPARGSRRPLPAAARRLQDGSGGCPRGREGTLRRSPQRLKMSPRPTGAAQLWAASSPRGILAYLHGAARRPAKPGGPEASAGRPAAPMARPGPAAGRLLPPCSFAPLTQNVPSCLVGCGTAGESGWASASL